MTLWEGGSSSSPEFIYKQFPITLSVQNHTYDSGVIMTEPTRDADGVKTFTCSNCGHTYTESVAKLTTPHTVTLVDYDGATLDTQTVNHNTAVTAPTSPSRTGYVCDGRRNVVYEGCGVGKKRGHF